MNTSSNKRAGKERLKSLGLPSSRLRSWWFEQASPGFWPRVGLCAAASVVMLLVCRTWQPPFPHRTGEYPVRNLVSRAEFRVPDLTATEAMRIQKRREAITYYANNDQPLVYLRVELKERLDAVLNAQSLESMAPEERKAFDDFDFQDQSTTLSVSSEDKFKALKSVLAVDPDLQQTDAAVQIALLPAMENGLLQSLTHTADQGDLRVIRVFLNGFPDNARVVEVAKVRITQARTELLQRLKEQFRQRFEVEPAQVVAEMIGHWLSSRLPETLRYDEELSTKAVQEMADQVEEVNQTYRRGLSVLAPAAQPLGPTQIDLLRREWHALTQEMGWINRFARLIAYAGMISALFLLGGIYIYSVHDRSLLTDPNKLARMLGLIVVTVSACYWASRDQWRAELIPLSMAAMVCVVVYGRELAMVLMTAISLAVTLFIGAGIATVVTLAAATLSCVLLLGRIRSRSHLLYVGLGGALVTAATVIGVGVVTGELFSLGEVKTDQLPLIPSTGLRTILGVLGRDAVWAGGSVLVAALVLTGLLPLVEKGFRVQTDLSLLELGDASHSLLRRLAQRAPGTYNHSINVASIAEAAADEIGVNGLLVRVGAYFHDIGKMFKPEYFIENQINGVNQHDALQPAMSTLVIIAHVKDGADLARNNQLPQPIIDFIQQHHGTTLVEYFYREAAKRSESNVNREEVSDKDFRYPGPKPQTLEAAVLMLADAVESASRTLVEPTPTRLTHLVDSIATKKMTDGQFDECGLTFKQLDQIKRSLIKSLTAIYHARVKYPGQQSA